MKLSRADVEWLLSTATKDSEPGDGRNESQKPGSGLDLRGADLRYADLHPLPMSHLQGSLTPQEWEEATTGQRSAATVLLTGANLSEAHLEYADLIGVHLENASLTDAHLAYANLAQSYLERAFLARTQLMKADLSEANLTKADSVSWEGKGGSG